MESISIRLELKVLILDEVANSGLSPTELITKWRDAFKELIRERESNVAANSNGDEELLDFLKNQEFQRNHYAIYRYLALLSFLYNQHKEDFERIAAMKMKGHRRKYVSKDRRELVASGEKVDPKRIPQTPYWAISRLSNKDKRGILARALRDLGYARETIDTVRSSLSSR